MKQRYIQSRYITPDDAEDIWQLLYPEHFVNMLLVHHLKQRSEKEISKVAYMMMDGLSKYSDGSSDANSLQKMLDLTDSELFHKTFETHKISDIFDPIQREDGTIVDPKLILIDGAPGMGKTTLCKQIAYSWATESLLNNSLVFLLFLRDPAVQNIYSLKDLIHYFYNFEKSASLLAEQCAEILFRRNDIDITIILDGYDEFCDNKGNLLVTKIGKRECLLHCKVVITSRPIASEKLQAISDIKVEVLGFTKESKTTFIEQELKSYPCKIKALFSFLRNHDAINSACFIPIMLTILVFTFKAYDELPNNESDLYERFVSLTISRFLQKLESSPPVAVLSLQDLPQIYKDYLSNICKFAFDAIKTKRIVFTEKDVEAVCSKFAISSNNFHGLGLLNFTKLTDYGKSKINQRISYSFVHLSIQEYLAAYYINSLKTCDQFQLLKNNFFADSFMNTWIMFIKMNKSITFEFQHMFCYSHVSGTSSEDVNNLWTTVMNINLFKDYYRIRGIKLDKFAGEHKVIVYKDNAQYFHQHKTTVSNYDTFWLFYRFDNLYARTDCIKVYMSLCSVSNCDNLLIEVYLLDKNTEETVYHNIVAELEHNHKLAVLLVSRGTLLGYRATAQQICDGLTMNGSLSTILLRDCHVTKGLARTLSQHLENNKALNFISIKKWKISDFQASVCFINAMKRCNTLVFLQLNNTFLSEDVAQDLADVIKGNPCLEQLHLYNNNLKAPATVILQALKGVSGLKKLDLGSNNMSSKVVDDVAGVIKSNAGLEELHLYNNNLQSSAVVILQALKGILHLKRLNLGGNKMCFKVADDLADVIKSNVFLEELNLFNNNLHLSLGVILQALKEISNLKKLDLGSNDLSGKLANDLADVIKRNAYLEELHLFNCNLESSTVDILRALQSNSSIKKLDLGNNDLSKGDVVNLVNVIKSNVFLEELYLFNSNLQSSAGVILQTVKGLPYLRKLDLGNNNLSENVADDLADIIKLNASLEELHLFNNNLNSSTIVILQDLKEVSNLRKLDLRSNNVCSEMMDELAGVTISNP